MTIAEIRGKLTPFEYMEDLLTSDVFSSFKYCNPSTALIPFLREAVRFDDLQTRPDIPDKVESAVYFFWPRSVVEPDVVIILTCPDRVVAVNIEAKYLSGKHNRDIDDASAEASSLSGDQLVDQFMELKELRYRAIQQEIGKHKRIDEFMLFYITAHFSPPIFDIEETRNKLAKLDKSTAVKQFFWLNWHVAYSICKSKPSPVLQDLAELLLKKGLMPLLLWRWQITAETELALKTLGSESFFHQKYWEHMHIIDTGFKGSSNFFFQ